MVGGQYRRWSLVVSIGGGGMWSAQEVVVGGRYRMWSLVVSIGGGGQDRTGRGTCKSPMLFGAGLSK